MKRNEFRTFDNKPFYRSFLVGILICMMTVLACTVIGIELINYLTDFNPY